MTLTRITSTAGDDPILGPLRKQLNTGAMVHWINQDLIERAGCDIRKSIVLYTADYTFYMALPASLTVALFEERAAAIAATLDRAGVTYWSKGLV